jgi:hypothetical protein
MRGRDYTLYSIQTFHMFSLGKQEDGGCSRVLLISLDIRRWIDSVWWKL